MVVHSRRLVIALATDAWLAACRWCSARTTSSAIGVAAGEVRFERGAQRRAAHVVLARAMQHLHDVGVVRAVGNRHRRRPAAAASRRATCASAARRAVRLIRISSASRRRFSISASFSMLGHAHSSPSVSGATR